MFFCTPKDLILIEKDTDIIIQGANTESSVIFSLYAKAEGCIPRINLEICSPDGEQLYLSHDYVAAEATEERKEWRFPMLPVPGMLCIAHIHIPENGRLHILEYSARKDEGYKRGSDKFLFDAHLGFFGAAPENTLPAFLYAARLGFDGCIANTRRTKDGVFVCMHDDEINRTARDADGKELEQVMNVSEMTYDELLQYDFGVHKHSCFKGTKSARFDEFLAVCKEYGMYPYVSTDNYLTKQDWLDIRVMLQEYGLLEKFRVKCNYIDLEGLKIAFSALENDIYGYNLWHFHYEEDIVEKLKSVGFDPKKTHGFIELLDEIDKPCYTEEIVSAIRTAGFIPSTVSCWERKNGEYYHRLIDMGVFEFNDDYHCSFGLNW